MVEIIKLGSLYFNGQPQEIRVEYNGEQITSNQGRKYIWKRKK